jgi:hypothetical protein
MESWFHMQREMKPQSARPVLTLAAAAFVGLCFYFCDTSCNEHFCDFQETEASCIRVFGTTFLGGYFQGFVTFFITSFPAWWWKWRKEVAQLGKVDEGAEGSIQ